VLAVCFENAGYTYFLHRFGFSCDFCDMVTKPSRTVQNILTNVYCKLVLWDLKILNQQVSLGK
jgi:23S rRNA C2498 (ribose-2'-O)-methylase RlmM